MFNILSYISNLGVETGKINLEKRGVILANRINFAMLLGMIVLYITTAVLRVINDVEMTIGSIRLLFVIACCILNIWLAYKGYLQLFKISIIYLPVFMTIILPTLMGFAEDMAFFDYRYFILTFSVVPQLILVHKKDLPIYYSSLAYFLFLIVYSDNLLSFFADKKYPSQELISHFYVFYKVIPIVIFFFIHLSIYYLRYINHVFEENLMASNEELKATIEELKTTQQHLIQSEKMASLGSLTSGVAHEINNPLNYINGGLYMLTHLKEDMKEAYSKKQTERFEEAYNIIHAGYERVLNIVKALMVFSNNGKSTMVQYKLDRLIENTLLLMNKKKPENIDIIKKLEFDGKIDMYLEKIHQLIINILDNAIEALNKSKSDNKRIEIRSWKENHKVYISIFNNGPKIREDKMHQIFDPFYTTKAPGEGPGLGLTICQSIVSDHNGKIKVVNKKDGVEFIIELPTKS